MVHIINTDALHSLKSDEFLPKVSRWMFLGAITLVSAVGAGLTISAVANYNVVVKGNAIVRPQGELKVVQSELEGTIQSIEVSENQAVKRGDPIAYLEDNKLQIQKSQLQGSIQQNQLQLTQLNGQIQFINAQILAETQAMERAIAVERAEMSQHQQEHEERQRTSNADAAEALVALAKAQDEMQRYQHLAEAGAITQLQLKEKESALRTAEIKVERAQAALNPSRAAITVSQEQAAQERARGEATIANLQKEKSALVQRQVEIQNQWMRDRKEIQQVERDLQRSVIRATSDGIIFKLHLVNAKQVVRSGDSIAQIAPRQAPLEIKAMVANQDIDQVKVGQNVQLRVSACPYPEYGILQGKVVAVAPDSNNSASSNTGGNLGTTGATQGSENRDRNFAVTIQSEGNVLVHQQRRCQIQPGMEASASIISRQETFLRFLLRKARILTDL